MPWKVNRVLAHFRDVCCLSQLTPNFVGKNHDIVFVIDVHEDLSAVNFPSHCILIQIVKVEWWVPVAFDCFTRGVILGFGEVVRRKYNCLSTLDWAYSTFSWTGRRNECWVLKLLLFFIRCLVQIVNEWSKKTDLIDCLGAFTVIFYVSTLDFGF